MKRWISGALACLFLAACSGESKTSIVQDGGLDVTTDGEGGVDSTPAGDADVVVPSDVPADSVQDVQTDLPDETCVPACGDRECGGDGCGGSCGTCPGGTQCGEGGQCLALTCESSKDCPLDLVCDKTSGLCVECVEDVDCPEEHACNAEQQCIPVISCESDKDCKAFDMVCNKETLQCVECLSEVDCPEGWLCEESLCVEPFCFPGERQCAGPQAVEVCNEAATAWEPLEECLEEQYCADGLCLDLACAPDTTWCDGQTAMACNADGTQVLTGEDCADSDKACVEGECVECVPDCAGKACGDDGCGGSCGECADGLPCVEGVCGTACDLAALAESSRGCEFWVVDLDNVEQGQLAPVGFVVAAPYGEDAHLTVMGYKSGQPVTLTAGDLSAETLTVLAGSSTVFQVPAGYDLDGTQLSQSTVRVLSDTPVAIYQLNPLDPANVYTSDGSLLLPVHLLDKQYVALSWGHRSSGYVMRGNVAVVATAAGTTEVTVTAAGQVVAGGDVPAIAPGETKAFLLTRGQVLNLETGGSDGNDLTGSIILADAPVAVFGAHECANVPMGTNYCDHIEQQLLPVTAWGTHYVLDPYAPRNASQKDIFRVTAGQNGTAVVATPDQGGPWSLEAGEWVELTATVPTVLSATGPIQVGHYMQGSNYPGFGAHPECNSGSGIGDPAFSIVVPSGRFAGEHYFVVPAGYTLDYLNIVGAKAALEGQLILDGDPLTGLSPKYAGDEEFGMVRVEGLADGFHHLEALGGPVGLTPHGYACDVGYAYPGGLGK